MPASPAKYAKALLSHNRQKLWLFSTIIGFFLLSACEGIATNAPPPVDQETRRKYEFTKGSVLGQEGFTPFSNDQSDNRGGIAVNAYLWRGALDTLSFLPMSQVDPFGGVMISEWYAQPETPLERFKITAYILDQELSASGIRVAVFRQIKTDQGEWQDAEVTKGMATRLEDAILTRARQLRIAAKAPVKE